ncbi:MAG: RNA polymerase sigma factor [Planctomycetota bacterium]|nr:MAG: RNA polymerase sigma factor [Planctomycetota bacterium]
MPCGRKSTQGPIGNRLIASSQGAGMNGRPAGSKKESATEVEAHDVEQIRAEGMEAIVRRHAPRVYRVVAAIVGEGEAEDATQEVFLRVQRGLSNWRGEASLGTWIQRIATNVALKRLRTRRRRPLRTGLEGGGVASPGPEPAAVAHRRERVAAVRHALARLPEHQRAVVALRMEGHSFAQVAQILGIRQPTAESRMARAKVRLRELLRDLVDAEGALGGD